MYQKHVTGLCQFMQDEVELEIRRAQAFGKLRRRGAECDGYEIQYDQCQFLSEVFYIPVVWSLGQLQN